MLTSQLCCGIMKPQTNQTNNRTERIFGRKVNTMTKETTKIKTEFTVVWYVGKNGNVHSHRYATIKEAFAHVKRLHSYGFYTWFDIEQTVYEPKRMYINMNSIWLYDDGKKTIGKMEARFNRIVTKQYYFNSQYKRYKTEC